MKQHCSIGSHEHQLHLTEKVVVDRCLAEEIKWLWSMDIVTVGSCCGHGNPRLAMIQVHECSIARMETIGYDHYKHPRYPKDKSYFSPKTIVR